MPLKILNHQILPRQLIMITKVIDPLISLQMVMVQYADDLVPFNPEYIPIVTFSLLVPFLSKGVKDTVAESCFEFYVRWVGGVVFLLYILSKVFRHFNY